MAKGPTKRDRLRSWLDEHRPEQIGPVEWNYMREALSPVSDSYLRELLRESGAVLDPRVEGVRQHTLEELAASLGRLAEIYEMSSADRETRTALRKLVIEARDRARWAGRKAAGEDKRKLKQEMVDWMRVWLENPGVFQKWVELRLRAMSSGN